MTHHKYVNEDEKFWDHSWLVSFSSHLGWKDAICVNADHAQDALDFAADYAMEQGWVGYFVDPDDEHYQEWPEEFSHVGNEGWIVQDTETCIKQLD